MFGHLHSGSLLCPDGMRERFEQPVGVVIGFGVVQLGRFGICRGFLGGRRVLFRCR